MFVHEYLVHWRMRCDIPWLILVDEMNERERDAAELASSWQQAPCLLPPLPPRKTDSRNLIKTPNWTLCCCSCAIYDQIIVSLLHTNNNDQPARDCDMMVKACGSNGTFCLDYQRPLSRDRSLPQRMHHVEINPPSSLDECL